MKNTNTIPKQTPAMKAQAIKQEAIAQIKQALKDAQKGVFLF